MRFQKVIQRIAVPAAMVCMLGLMGAQDDTAGQFTIAQGISVPSAKSNPTFPDLGIIHEILVKPNDHVKVGQVLATEDSDLEELELKVLKMQAESTAEVDAAIKDRDSKKIMRDNMQKAYDSAGAANESELQEAKLAYDEAEIKIIYAREQHDQAVVKAVKQEKKVEKMKLLSPVDGVVQKVNLQPGEVVDPNKPDGVVTVVQNAPLWVEMHLSSALAAKLKLNDSLQVSYGSDANHWVSGTVIYFDPVVDAASDTQTVRLQLENAEGFPAGLQMNIRLPFVADKTGAAASR